MRAATEYFSGPGAAYRAAVRMLARSDRTMRELRQRLSRGGFSSEAIETACDALVSEGLYDESRVAESLVRRLRASGKGSNLIRRELSQRGLSDAAVDEALGDESEDEYPRVQQLCEQYVEHHPDDDSPTIERRLQGYLQRRGYDASMSRRAIREVLASRAS